MPTLFEGTILYNVGSGVRFCINNHIPDDVYICDGLNNEYKLSSWLPGLRNVMEHKTISLRHELILIYLSLDSFYNLVDYLDGHITVVGDIDAIV